MEKVMATKKIYKGKITDVKAVEFGTNKLYTISFRTGSIILIKEFPLNIAKGDHIEFECIKYSDKFFASNIKKISCTKKEKKSILNTYEEKMLCEI